MSFYKMMFVFSALFSLSGFFVLSTGGCQQVPELTATVGANEQGTTQASSGKFPTYADVFSPSTFAARRTRLAESIPEGLVVLFGEKGVIDAWDEHRHNSYFRVQGFRQEENLFYLTGLSMPGVAVVLTGLTGKTSETRVYVPRVSDKVGAELARLGLGEPIPMEQLEKDLDKTIGADPVYMLARSHDSVSTQASFGVQAPFPSFLPGGEHGTYREDTIVEGFKKRFPKADVRSILPIMEEMRRVKDDEEIAALRRAAQISARGLMMGIATVAPGVDEREVAAEIEYAFKRAGAQFTAYSADIQSGPNSMRGFVDLFGSYDLENRTMEAGELVMVDHSAEVNYYVSDLARTVPVSGRFNPEQRLAYETYLAAFEAGLEALGPGVPFMRAGEMAAQTMQERLDDLPDWPDWLRGPAERFAERVGKRRSGHYLGMNMHIHEDYTSPLRPGQVMSYELHLYIPDKGWRITLEEVVLITDDGHEVFTKELPRSVEGIEKLMSGGAS